MKKRLLLFISVVMCFICLHAQGTTETVNVAKAGTLQELISNMESLRINNLTVTGEINGADFAYITKMTGKLIDLQFLDISNVKLVIDDTPYRTVTAQGSDLHSYTSIYYFSETNSDGETDIFDKTTDYYRNNLASAFYGMKTLKEVKLPKSLPSIGEEMFTGCTALTSVEFPENLKEIGYSAFWKCPALSVSLPAGLETIGMSAFRGCSSLKGDLDLSRIKSLGHDAFSGCVSLTSLILSTELEKIEASVFSECEGLTSVTFSASPGKLKEIEERAFLSCKGLTSIEIPEGVESIGEGAFGSSSLTSVVIPASVYKIGEGAFGDTPWWKAKERETKTGPIYIGKVLYKWAGTMPENTSVTLEEGATGIADRVFDRQLNIVGISLPNSFKSIGNYSFNGCKNLQTVEFNEGLTSIGEQAFADCSGLASVTIPSTVTYLGDKSFFNCLGLVKVNFNAKSSTTYEYGSIFGGCTGLEVAVIGEGVEVIPPGLFYECTGLMSVSLPETLEIIGRQAFSRCSSLKSLTIPNSVTRIETYAFKLCSSLKNLVIGENVSYIGEYAFDNCTSLEEVTIPEKVEWMGSVVFSGCTKLTKVNYNAISCNDYQECHPFGNSLSTVIIGDKVEIIPARLFSSCSKLSSVTFTNPDKLKYIGSQAFDSTPWYSSLPSGEVIYIGKIAYAYKKAKGAVDIKDGTTALAGDIFRNAYIESIKLPNTLQIIGEWAISGNYLDSINIPESVSSIMSCGLSGSRNLKTILFPEGLDSIAPYTLNGCINIEMINIPASVKTIGKEAFSACPKLKEIYCEVETPINITGKDVFINSMNPSTCKLYVPENSVDLYKAAEVWKEFDVQSVAAGIEGVVAEDRAVNVIPSARGITIIGNNGANVTVYDATGKIVYHGKDTSIGLAVGMYIVKVGEVTQKVVVR